MTMQLNKLSLALLMGCSSVAYAQQINDNNTPLHLMKPAYKVGYGVSTAESVKQTMDRVLKYIDAETPAVLVDKKTGKEITRLKDINADTQLKQGGFRLTSYEWGVTYSGVLAAYEATGDAAYKDYVYKRHKLLAEMAPYFTKIHQKGATIDVNVRRVVDPHALDDAGAVCCSMMKAMATIFKDSDKGLRQQILRRGCQADTAVCQAHVGTREELVPSWLGRGDAGTSCLPLGQSQRLGHTYHVRGA